MLILEDSRMDIDVRIQVYKKYSKELLPVSPCIISELSGDNAYFDNAAGNGDIRKYQTILFKDHFDRMTKEEISYVLTCGYSGMKIDW